MTPEEQAAFDKLKTDLAKAIKAAADNEQRAVTAEAAAIQVKADADVSVALIAKGITDPDDRDTIMSRYNKIDPEGRPEFGKWLAKAEKADRIVSRIVADVTAQAAAGKGGGEDAPEGKAAGKGAEGADAGKAAKDEPAALPGAPAGKTAPAPGPKGWSPEKVLAASTDDIRANIETIRKEYGYNR